MSEGLPVWHCMLDRRAACSIFAAALLTCLALSVFSDIASASDSEKPSLPTSAGADPRGAAPDAVDSARRPMRRVETDDGVTVLTNSSREPERARPRPEPPVTRQLAAPQKVRLVLPEEREAQDASNYTNWWGVLALLAGATALSIVFARRRRARRSSELTSATLPARASLPPATLAFVAKERAAGATQWVSQGRRGRRVTG